MHRGRVRHLQNLPGVPAAGGEKAEQKPGLMHRGRVRHLQNRPRVPAAGGEKAEQKPGLMRMDTCTTSVTRVHAGGGSDTNKPDSATG